jgi:blue copper oxidase
MAAVNRRSLLAGMGLLLGTGACSRPLAAVGGTGSALLPIPPLVDARQQGAHVSLGVQTGQTAFYPGRPSITLGYNGGYLGPTIRVHRGDDVSMAVTNGLRAETTVHWHGLLIPGELDGGPHQTISPGATWRPVLPIRQPAATLLYHSHVHGLTAEQVYSGLAGALLVTDEEEQGLGLPSDYGVDDLPLLIQDRQFQDGRLVLPTGMMVGMEGRRGSTILVNGAPSPLAKVPGRLVRLRLVNASNARIYELSFSDRRTFHWIGTEGGLLDRPVELQAITLAPGQRAELLVNFADGRSVSLVSGPDTNLSAMMMGGMGTGRGVAANAAVVTVLQFEPQAKGQARAVSAVPAQLVSRTRPDASKVATRRRLVLNMGMGGTMGTGGGGMALTINGKPFDMKRIDETVKLGATEIWEVSGEMMRHPLHIHGVHFDVLSRGGARPDVLDQGARDTVLVKEPVELLIRFDQPARTAPFMYHCHIPEHEDNGMMGQFSVA